jgi:chromosome segregation ATPase
MSLSNDEVVQSLMATMDSINKQLANERKERKQEKKESDEKIAELLQEIEKVKSKKSSSDTQELLKKYGELDEQNQSLIERNRILEKDVIDKTNEYQNMKEQRNRAQEKQKDVKENKKNNESDVINFKFTVRPKLHETINQSHDSEIPIVKNFVPCGTFDLNNLADYVYKK